MPVFVADTIIKKRDETKRRNKNPVIIINKLKVLIRRKVTGTDKERDDGAVVAMHTVITAYSPLDRPRTPKSRSQIFELFGAVARTYRSQ